MSKTDGSRLPKTIAGLRVPKALRRPGLLDELISTGEGRMLLAEALMKGAEAAAGVLLRATPSDDDDVAQNTEAAVSTDEEPRPEPTAPFAEQPVAEEPEKKPSRRGRPGRRRPAEDAGEEPTLLPTEQ